MAGVGELELELIWEDVGLRFWEARMPREHVMARGDRAEWHGQGLKAVELEATGSRPSHGDDSVVDASR